MKKTIEELYGEFTTRNPHIAEELYNLAVKAYAAGRERIGIKHLIEVLRWDQSLKTDSTGQPLPAFKINNNFAPLYARDLMKREPEFSRLFETRKLAYERPRSEYGFGRKMRRADFVGPQRRVMHALLSEKPVDQHRQKAAEIFGVPVEQVTPEQRRAGKAANFALWYGGKFTAASIERFMRPENTRTPEQTEESA